MVRLASARLIRSLRQMRPHEGDAALRVQTWWRASHARKRFHLRQLCHAGKGVSLVTAELFASRPIGGNGNKAQTSGQKLDMMRMHRCDDLVAGPVDIFLPIGNAGAVMGNAAGSLSTSMEGTAELCLNWQFWPQKCINQSVGIAFGVLELSEPQLRLISLDGHAGSLPNQPIYVRLTVVIGSCMSRAWFLRPTLLRPGFSKSWPYERRRFHLRRFGEHPLVQVNIGSSDAHDEPCHTGDMQAQAAFFKLPLIGGSERLTLPLVAPNGPAFIPTEAVKRVNTSGAHTVSATDSRSGTSANQFKHGSSTVRTIHTAFSKAIARPAMPLEGSHHVNAIDASEMHDMEVVVGFSWTPHCRSSSLPHHDAARAHSSAMDASLTQAFGKFRVDDVDLQGIGQQSRRETLWRRGVTVAVDASSPCRSGSQVVCMSVPRGGCVIGEVLVDWVTWRGGHKDADISALKYMCQHVGLAEQNEAVTLANKLRFFNSSKYILLFAFLRRDSPLTKIHTYSALISRKQRYAVLTSSILVAVLFTVIFFTRGVDCYSVPPSAACSPTKGLFARMWTWNVLFGSLWTVLLSVPMPLALISCFKKPIIFTEHTERHKLLRMRIWQCKERAAWLVVIATHLVMVFASAWLVQRYPWALVEIWFASTFWQLYHRFVTAVIMRSVLSLIIACGARTTAWFDVVLALKPSFVALRIRDNIHAQQRLLAAADLALPTTAPERSRVWWSRVQASVLQS